MRLRILIPTVVASLAATFVSAQPIIDYDAMPTPRQTIQTDLDEDGTFETIAIFALNDMFDVITVTDGFPHTAFVLPINLSGSDSLSLAPNGNLHVNYGCFACGRYHSFTTLTIDSRDNALQVIGFDHTYLDRHFAAAIECSVNLLTGNAVVSALDVDEQRLTTARRAYPVRDIAVTDMPQVCNDGFARYDDEFLQRNYTEN